jgi:hypothetical protein
MTGKEPIFETPFDQEAVVPAAHAMPHRPTDPSPLRHASGSHRQPKPIALAENSSCAAWPSMRSDFKLTPAQRTADLVRRPSRIVMSIAFFDARQRECIVDKHVLSSRLVADDEATRLTVMQ